MTVYGNSLNETLASKQSDIALKGVTLGISDDAHDFICILVNESKGRRLILSRRDIKICNSIAIGMNFIFVDFIDV